MLTTLKALADPTRLRLLAVLSRGEFTVQELTEILAMGQSRISRHLKILRDAALLGVDRQGTWAYYRLAPAEGAPAAIWQAVAAQSAELPEQAEDHRRLGEVLEARRQKSQNFFDRHARQWDELARQAVPLARYREALLAVLPTCTVLLEAGVGTGSLLGELRQRAERLIGVDHSGPMLAEAQRRLDTAGLTGVELRLGELNHLPLADGEADAALLNMVLHHAARPQDALAEVARVLAPGGALLIADLLRHGQEWLRERLADQWLGFTRAELDVWLADAGFRIDHYAQLNGTADDLGVFLLVARRDR